MATIIEKDKTDKPTTNVRLADKIFAKRIPPLVQSDDPKAALLEKVVSQAICRGDYEYEDV